MLDVCAERTLSNRQETLNDNRLSFDLITRWHKIQALFSGEIFIWDMTTNEAEHKE